MAFKTKPHILFRNPLAWAFGLVLVVSMPAQAVRVGTLVRISGSESKGTMVGLGLVTGLNDTGDGKTSTTTIRQLVAMFNRLGDPLLEPSQLTNADNVAVVLVEARVPEGGARQGDRIDVSVSAPFAKSLKGGRLISTPLVDPKTRRHTLAFASGNVRIEDEENAPNNGVIRGAASLVKDFKPNYVNTAGQMMLVLKQSYARWAVAQLIATNINDRLMPARLPGRSNPAAGSSTDPMVARAVDQKNILINVPKAERANPGAFISQILEITVPPELVLTGATIVINRKAKTVVISGDVELSPVAMSVKGTRIQLVAAGPTSPAVTGNQLLEALQAATIQPDEQITLILELHKSGKLHGELVLE